MFKRGVLKVAAATPAIVTGDVAHNRDEILKILNESDAGAIVFPELSITGYSASDLFYQESFIRDAHDSLKVIMDQTTFKGIYIIGAPLELFGILYNCAIVFQHHKILGVIPKHYLPNYHEFYEKRWFHTGFKTEIKSIQLFGQDVPFGYLIFESEKHMIRFGVEICQDLWATYTPADDMSLAGANLIFNLSASTERVNKPAVRRHLVLDHSRKQMTAYVYTSSGHFESTSEVVFSPHKIIANQGTLVVEDRRFINHSTVISADIDLMGINYQKRMDSTYRDMHMLIQNDYQFIPFQLEEVEEYLFSKPPSKAPFLDMDNLYDRFEEANELQVFALMSRLNAMPKHSNRIVIGISGGLDSTLALLVSHQAMKNLGRDPKEIIAVTMPAEVTSSKTLNLSKRLMDKLIVTAHTIPINDALDLHLKSIDHHEKDVTYENAQARIRTLILMDLANKHGGFVLGTGDLSEIALGFMTYNGDQMSMYAINSGLPKTWIKALIKHHMETRFSHLKDELTEVLESPISPELKKNQETEDIIGRYDINDFILYHHLENGADSHKIIWLLSAAYGLTKDESFTYVDRFFRRFYSQQFKRQTLPEGPKILGISLSPRGQYRLPSDVKRK